MSKKLAEVKIEFTLDPSFKQYNTSFFTSPSFCVCYTGRESLNNFSVFMNSQCALTFSAINWKMSSTILKLLFAETCGSYLVLFLGHYSLKKNNEDYKFNNIFNLE